MPDSFDVDPATAAAATPAGVPGPDDEAGLGRLWAACVAEERARAEARRDVRPSARTLRDYLATHRLVWDMPSLCEVFPEVTEHLEARYHLEHHDGEVTVSSLAATADRARAETFATDDVRHVVDVLLSREHREALRREGVQPAHDRLVG